MTQPTAPRMLVSPPTFVDRNYGLLSVVQPRYDEPDAHWRNGVTWTSLCGVALSTFDPCTVSGVGLPAPTKTATSTVTRSGARPFTVFGKVDCSPVGFSQEEERSRAVDALTRTEAWQVERAFLSGRAGSNVNIVLPHLAHTASIVDTMGIQLQCATTQVTGTTVLDVVEGLERLEAAIGSCIGGGQATIHIPLILGEAFFAWSLIKDSGGGQLKTNAGNLVALGAGYDGRAPDGTVQGNVGWIYATGPVFAYRSAPETFTFTEELNRTNNTLETIVERTYVLGFDCCCLYGVAINIGGDVTGQPLSAF